MLESSGASASTSESVTEIRASFAIWRTVFVSTDMAARLASLLRCIKASGPLPSPGLATRHRIGSTAAHGEEAIPSGGAIPEGCRGPDRAGDRRGRRLSHFRAGSDALGDGAQDR